MNFLVIGGNGFLGKAIVELLLERKYIVSVFDISKSHDDHRLSAFHVGDITNPAHVSNACKGVDIVIHTASPIHGKPAPVYFKVNVDGTANIIAACVEHGVSKLIFTSSASVIYNGQDLCDADETTPYCEIHMDAYNESKAIAEKLVLESNGKNGLLTCSIRPSGIFGPRDSQGSLAIVQAAKRGQWRVMIGDNENLFDMTYVDNAAYAHILAAERMTANSGIDGQAFIITNDQPIFFWDYPKAIYEGLGYKETQKIVLSKSFGLALGSFMDTVTWILSPFVTLHPSFTRFRVVIINGNRYFNIAKAKKLLGYSPIVDWNEAVTRTVQFYKEQESH